MDRSVFRGRRRHGDSLHRYVERRDGLFLFDNPPGSPNGAGAQCVNLANDWLVHLGFLPLPGNAVDFAGAVTVVPGTRQRSRWVDNRALNMPRRGSLVVFSGALGGGAGHIDVALYGSDLEYVGFDQNWPEGGRCQRIRHDYGSVLGWLDLSYRG